MVSPKHQTCQSTGILTTMVQWIGLMENLQETIDFPSKYGLSCKFSLKPIHWMLYQAFLSGFGKSSHAGYMATARDFLVSTGRNCLTPWKIQWCVKANFLTIDVHELVRSDTHFQANKVTNPVISCWLCSIYTYIRIYNMRIHMYPNPRYPHYILHPDCALIPPFFRS